MFIDYIARCPLKCLQQFIYSSVSRICSKILNKSTQRQWSFTLTTISFTSVYNIAFYNIHFIVALVPAAVFSCCYCCTVAMPANVGPGVCWAENNECIMWNGFLPQPGPGKQWSQKQGFVLREFQSWHFACPGATDFVILRWAVLFAAMMTGLILHCVWLECGLDLVAEVMPSPKLNSHWQWGLLIRPRFTFPITLQSPSVFTL